ncbi:MAG TPA: hypothetical protein VHO70_20275 [Chitinispirillaceae bacterium]|nr:hypothetical protein [Chitinispirillaceae bacterium]
MVVDFLSTRKSAKPKTITTLRNLIISTCKNEISESHADGIIQQLIADNVIISKEDYVSYVNN